jgi:hypothetical protein
MAYILVLKDTLQGFKTHATSITYTKEKYKFYENLKHTIKPQITIQK